MKKILKKILTIVLGLAVTGGVLGAIFGYASIKKNDTLVFGNFGEYESPSLQTSIASQIESEYKGVNVEYTYYNLNNQLPAMYSNDQISIGVPTDYEAAALISYGLIKPLDYSLFNEYGMRLGYYSDGTFIKIENGILPIQVNLSQENEQYHTAYTLDGNGNNKSMSISEQYATEYKYSICNLLSPGTICDLTQIYLHCDFNNMSHIDILDYDLPYFFQNYTFAYFTPTSYSVNQTNQIVDSFGTVNNPISWEDILNNIENNNIFYSRNNRPRIGMVSSPQSVYSVASSIKYGGDGSTTPITNPLENQSTIYQLTNVYQFFTNQLSSRNLGNNPMYLSQSSAGIINELDNSQLQGGFCYNGDALYTAMGGNLANNLSNSQWSNLTPETFHVAHPKYTMIALDTVGINSKLPQNLLLPAYKFMYDLCLQGCDAYTTFGENSSAYTTSNFINTEDWLKNTYGQNNTLWKLISGEDQTTSCPFYFWLNNKISNPWSPQTDNSSDFIGAISANGNYVNNVMQNFSFNLYVSPWLNINNYVDLSISSTGANYINNALGETNVLPGMNWFTSQDSYPFSTDTSLSTLNSFNNWFDDIYTIDPTNYIYVIPSNINFKVTPYTCVELPLSYYQISNQQIAFNSAIYQSF